MKKRNWLLRGVLLIIGLLLSIPLAYIVIDAAVVAANSHGTNQGSMVLAVFAFGGWAIIAVVAAMLAAAALAILVVIRLIIAVARRYKSDAP